MDYVYDWVVTPRSDLPLLAATLRGRGQWIPVLMDAEARKRAKAEGLRIAEPLNELGVDVCCAHAETGAWSRDGQPAVRGHPAGQRPP